MLKQFYNMPVIKFMHVKPLFKLIQKLTRKIFKLCIGFDVVDWRQVKLLWVIQAISMQNIHMENWIFFYLQVDQGDYGNERLTTSVTVRRIENQ